MRGGAGARVQRRLCGRGHEPVFERIIDLLALMVAEIPAIRLLQPSEQVGGLKAITRCALVTISVIGGTSK